MLATKRSHKQRNLRGANKETSELRRHEANCDCVGLLNLYLQHLYLDLYLLWYYRTNWTEKDSFEACDVNGS